MSNVRLTADIAAAYVRANQVAAANLPELLKSIFAAIESAGNGAPGESSPDRPSATEIRRSIKPDGLLSFIDGRPYKMLKPHLAAHGLTPEAYKARFGLPANYPMTAAVHSAKRAAVARAAGLGTRGSARKTAGQLG